MANSRLQTHAFRRADLLGRLAAERARLFLLLEGVTEDNLTRSPVSDGWTATGLLAHLAYWEAFAADRLSKLSEGHRSEIQPLGGEDTLDRRNAAMQARFAHLTFSEAVALCQKERRNFLMALQRLPDETLFRRIQLRPGWRITPLRWARRPHRHDAEHAGQLSRWRAALPPNHPSLRVIHRSLLRPILGLSRAEFLALAALVPHSQRETRPLDGAWTLTQIVGHISDYERLGIGAFQAIAAGRDPQYETEIVNFDAFNNRQGPIWAKYGWNEAWANYVATRQALLKAAEALAPEDLERPFPAPWPETTTVCGFLLDMAQHEQEHADALRRSLGLSALPRRLGR